MRQTLQQWHRIGTWLRWPHQAPAPVDENAPYAELFRTADRSGRVLHREHIYGVGPVVSEEIFNFVFARTGSSVLDVGCSIGPYVDRLNREGRRCEGVDTNPELVLHAQALGRPVQLMSGYQLAYDDNSFDSVILIETLEHLEHFELAIQEAARVARRTMVVTVPDISVLPIMSRRQVIPWHLLEATHVNFFTPVTLRGVLGRYSRECRTYALGEFMRIDGVPVHMHIGAVAYV